jgi:tRNA A58 N-methylase Trm61
MFIKVTEFYTGSTFLVNTNNIYCVVEHEEHAEIIYTDDSSLIINESIIEIERMMKEAGVGAVMVLPSAQLKDAEKDIRAMRSEEKIERG